MKKSKGLSLLSGLLAFIIGFSISFALIEYNKNKELEENSSVTLIYTHSDENNHYFIEPSKSSGYVVLGLNDYEVLPELKIDVTNLKYGDKFEGLFIEEALINIKKVGTE